MQFTINYKLAQSIL